MRRSRRQRENENPMIEAIKYYQRSVTKAIWFVALPLALLFVAFTLWIQTPSGRDFMGFTENDIKSEQRLKKLQDDMKKQEESLQEQINQDVENTINDIQGATEDSTGAEYYDEDVYTTPEVQESVEQPRQETNATRESTYETKEIEEVKPQDATQATPPKELPEPVPDESRIIKGSNVDYDEEGNVIEREDD